MSNESLYDVLQSTIADLERQVAALTKENERLQTACNKFSESEILEGNKLAASQLREQQLREAIDKEVPFVRTSDMPLLDAALTLPSDDTALQARLKEEREKIVKVVAEWSGNKLDQLAAYIRSMT